MTPARLGATVVGAGVEFVVWAPDRTDVEVVFFDTANDALALTRDADGYYHGVARGVRAGAVYQYRLDGRELRADPYSRFQPEGPHGASMVIDPTAYRWQDAAWQGLDASRQVIYELHVGTFTPEGTYAAASSEFPALVDLGITAIEILPVNTFEGRFGWGYDGVNWFAPFASYGTPDALRAMVDCAHRAGLGVILDVVYNHFGSYGNYLPRFAENYLDHATPNPWGGAPNYSCDAMRRMAIDNGAYWIREFHFDGLRLDATQNIHDPRHPSLLGELVSGARAAAQGRPIVISGEDYLQRAPLLTPLERGGAGLDQLWNDDFHHAARIALTGNHDGYLKAYRGRSQELLSAMLKGYLFQGQFDRAGETSRGSPVKTEPASAFVVCTQNHDQVANTLFGARLHSFTSPGKYRAITAALLLGPNTPMLFMGQEFNASAPFAYFADYHGEVAAGLWNGRRRELLAFTQYCDPAAQAAVFDPTAEGDPKTMRARFRRASYARCDVAAVSGSFAAAQNRCGSRPPAACAPGRLDSFEPCVRVALVRRSRGMRPIAARESRRALAGAARARAAARAARRQILDVRLVEQCPALRRARYLDAVGSYGVAARCGSRHTDDRTVI